MPYEGERAVIAYNGAHSIEDGVLELEGQLYVEGHNPPQDIYRDVRITLYSEEGELIQCKALGSLDASAAVNISLSTSNVPFYVIFASHDFGGIRPP